MNVETLGSGLRGKSSGLREFEPATTMVVCGCLRPGLFASVFGEQWTTQLTPVIPDRVPLFHTPTMAENSTLLRALQRFANAARKINPNPPPTLTTQDAPSVLTSLPNHKPLLPLLLSHNIPSKLAKACSDKYDGYASQLKSKTESKLAPYLAYRKKCHPFQAYSLFLNHYNQTLRRWSQSILNTALMSLKRDSVELRNLEVTHLAPLWLPVCLSSCISISESW